MSTADRRVLIVGQRTSVLRGILQTLRDKGVTVTGRALEDDDPDTFDATDVDVVAIGRGLLGPVGDRLTARFVEQNPDVLVVATMAPVAVDQILAALAHDPRTPRFLTDLRVSPTESRIEATILAPCRVRVTVYHLTAGELKATPLDERDAEPGPFTHHSEVPLAGALSVVLVAGDEYHHHPFLG